MKIEKLNKSHNIKEILRIDLEAVEDFYELIKDKYSQNELLNIEAIHQDCRGEYFIGSLDNKIIAICGYKIIDKDTVELRRFRVQKDYRSNGLGSVLLNHVEVKIKKKHFNKIVLETAVVRPSTLKFYSNKGYEKVGEGSYGNLQTVQFEKLVKQN